MATGVFITGLAGSQAAGQEILGSTGVNRGFRVRAYLPAQLITTQGSNKDLIFTARALGTAGNAVTVTYTLSGNGPTSVGVSSNAITVTTSTSASAVAATQTLTTSATGAANNDTVVVNGRTYTFKTTLTGAANEVVRDGTIDHDLTNLKAAINNEAGAGTLYGTGTTVNADVTCGAVTSHAVTLTAKTAGVAGNSLTLTTTGGIVTAGGATFSGGKDAKATAAQVRNAIRASSTANALVAVALADGQTGAGQIGAMSATNLAGGTNPAQTEDFGDLTGSNRNQEVAIQPNKLYQVDVDDPWVRQKLARAHGNIGIRKVSWIECPTGSLTRVPVRSLLTESSAGAAQSFISRGTALPQQEILYPDQVGGAGGLATSTQASVNSNTGSVEIDVTNPAVRRALRTHPGRWCAAAPNALSSSLVTVRGLMTTKSAPSSSGGYGLSSGRGFRIPKWEDFADVGSQSNLGYVNSTTNVQVDLADSNVRRALRRNVGRWIVVTAP